MNPLVKVYQPCQWSVEVGVARFHSPRVSEIQGDVVLSSRAASRLEDSGVRSACPLHDVSDRWPGAFFLRSGRRSRGGGGGELREGTKPSPVCSGRRKQSAGERRGI